MQIVINIDNEDYDDITLAGDNTINLGVLLDLREAVRKGTPLPKRHGDLIDRGELLKLPIDKANYPSNYVKYVQTIIEADRSEEDG